MKRILSIGLALMMVLSLAACGSKSDDGKETPTEVDMTAQEIMDALKAELGDMEILLPSFRRRTTSKSM